MPLYSVGEITVAISVPLLQEPHLRGSLHRDAEEESHGSALLCGRDLLRQAVSVQNAIANRPDCDGVGCGDDHAKACGPRECRRCCDLAKRAPSHGSLPHPNAQG